MKKEFILLFALTVITSNSFSQFNLKIEIAGIRNNDGKIMLQLFDENEKVLKEAIGIIKDNCSVFSITGLKKGKYAVRYYHDENLNGKMETNAFGKPTEGYGFSNNVTGKFGPPPFEKWLFELESDKKIMLKPAY
jgi:uncharacterized protein (DUF2141 family)